MGRITEFAWNLHFCDEQIRGPFTEFRHCHGIQAEVLDGIEGTQVSDEIEFVLPYGILGMAAGMLVRRELKTAFAYRHKRLPEILAVAARQAARRA
jgi:ligand-binding SRPBCC domain-containing protein